MGEEDEEQKEKAIEVTYISVVALRALHLVLYAHDALLVDAHVRLLRHAQSL